MAITAYSVAVNLQNGTDRTVYATWDLSAKNVKKTDYYSYEWYYDTGNGLWFTGTKSTTTEKQIIYNAPSNATKVKFKVKPIAKKKTVNGKEQYQYTSNWSTQVEYTFMVTPEPTPDNPTPEPVIPDPPKVPPIPTISVDKYTLLASVDDYEDTTTVIEFEIARNDQSVYAVGQSGKVTNYASYSCAIASGDQYKVRCRGIRVNEYSAWSEYSANVGTIPLTPAGITSCTATSSTSVRIEWSPVSYATKYDIEYATNKNYFDASSETRSISVNSVVNYAEITGLDTGEQWFFRVRSGNAQGESGWCNLASVIIGKAPSAPTTWSTTTTAVVGEQVNLYWVHNSEDGSKQTNAQLELTVNGVIQIINIVPTVIDGENSNNGSYTLNTSIYNDGAKIKWRVKTKGIIATYSPWSIQRAIDIFAPPTLAITMGDGNLWFWNTFNFNLDSIYTADGTISAVTNTLLHFPYFIKMVAGPSSQQAISYYVSITASESYNSTDRTGMQTIVNAGEVVYYKNIDKLDNDVTVYLNANEIDLENNITYNVYCMVSMNTGLTAEAISSFKVQWTEQEYEPDAAMGYDKDRYIMYVRPYCEDDNEVLIPDVMLSVYRREFDGSFVELAVGLDNVNNTTVTDPHPSLDYARYRIVAISKTTGSVSYYDVPGYPVAEKGIIIQWSEEWTSFDTMNEDEGEKPTWTGSLLRLPYNIQVSDSNDSDVSLVNYIGRKHPVSYYGTQLGSASVWNADIDKTDEDTLYAIRRLSVWMGDVYVREPSGSGYWAQIKVSYSQKYDDLVIPITFNVTRVEGGI
jgi:hypothetical protein